jgi:glycosyltransferase involved in cell wall biosynthesis
MFEGRYGVAPVYLPFSIYRPWTARELTPACRAAARTRLGIAANEVVIATFGFVSPSKAPKECIWALDVLRNWSIPATLHFVGGLDDSALGAGVPELAERLGHKAHVRFADDFVTEDIYRDYLVGADLAIQLRTYGLGGLSGALLDCAAAGLPTVTNASLGAAVGVPSYVRCIPDSISPLLLAEALADLIDASPNRVRNEKDRVAFSNERSFKTYSERLFVTLGVDTGVGVASGR